jgi:hypothetical protein
MDDNGYPMVLKNTETQYFQDNGLWYRETGGLNSSTDINTGNNPHIGPYDGGSKYLNRFRHLLPDFKPTVINNEEIYEETHQVFTNYKSGTFTGLVGTSPIIYVKTYDRYNNILNNTIVEKNIIKDPKPQEDLTCDCIGKDLDDALSIKYNCYTEPLIYSCNYSGMTLLDNGIVSFQLLNGTSTIDLSQLPDNECCTDLGYVTGSTSGMTVCRHNGNPIIIDYLAINTSCNQSNGSIVVNNVSGGTGQNYDIQVVGSTNVSSCHNCTNLYVPNLESGSYSIIATDGNLTTTIPININNIGDAITGTKIETHKGCGLTEVVINNISGGTPCNGINILLDGVVKATNFTGTNYSFGDLPNGGYLITLSGACGNYPCNNNILILY